MRFAGTGLFVVCIAGCYASHAPWDRAAPDGSAISLRVEVSPGRGAGAGFLEVRFDGSYAASPMNELRVCTGVMDVGELAEWSELIEHTRAFELEGVQGRSVTDGGITRVELASRDGLSTSFELQGGPAFAGYDPALTELADRAEAFWSRLAIDECGPERLDPSATRLSASFTLWEVDRAGRIEVRADGSVHGSFDRFAFDHELTPCAPLAEREALLASVLSAAPFDPRLPEVTAPREVWLGVRSAVGDERHDRWAYTMLRPSRPEQAELGDALIALAFAHCDP